MPENRWDRVVDVLVAGTGAADLSAAVILAERGASVHVVEKAPDVGGTTRKSAGFMWIPNNHFLQEAGVTDERDGALRYMARLSRPLRYDPSHPTLGLAQWEYDGIAAHYDNAANAIVALTSIGAIDVAHATEFPDFSQRTRGRSGARSSRRRGAAAPRAGRSSWASCRRRRRSWV